MKALLADLAVFMLALLTAAILGLMTRGLR